MITRLEVAGFRCLRYVHARFDRLQIFVGPNASGKTTLLDALSFLADLVLSGPAEAFRLRSANPLDLFWMRQPGTMEFALEAQLPQKPRYHDFIRYEAKLELNGHTLEPKLVAERVLLKKTDWKTIVTKLEDGKAEYESEFISRSSPNVFNLGSSRSALANLPADEFEFPSSLWLRQLLRDGVQRITLNSLLLRQASPPGQAHGFRPDGSNLPWVVQDIQQNHEGLFRDWIAHIRTALPAIEDIRVVVREDDKHAYLMVRYSGGLEIPSWVLSDGTLRLLALTLLAYVPDFDGVYLVEEPENGIHPTAIETLYQSLTSVYDGQVLVASHSPILLNIARPEQLLCFAKDEDGATDIVRGDEHQALLKWKGEVPLGTFFAFGILG